MMSSNTVPKGILIYVLMALAVLVPVSVYLVPAGIFSPCVIRAVHSNKAVLMPAEYTFQCQWSLKSLCQ